MLLLLQEGGASAEEREHDLETYRCFQGDAHGLFQRRKSMLLYDRTEPYGSAVDEKPSLGVPRRPADQLAARREKTLKIKPTPSRSESRE